MRRGRAAERAVAASLPLSPGGRGLGVCKASGADNNGTMFWRAPVLFPVSSSRRWRIRWRQYVRATQRPLYSLLFLLPLVVVYELAAWRMDDGTGGGRNLLAHSAIAGLLSWFGLVGVWGPPVVLVVALLTWHYRRRDRWRVRWWVLPGMLGEGLVLAIPLLVFSALFQPPQPGVGGSHLQLVQGLGAGIYEELVFRLLLISGMTWLLVEVFRVWRPAATWTAVALAAVVFSLCHFAPIGAGPFAWGAFWFRVLAGVYLSVIFVGRGVGVSSGSHAAYNMLLVWLRS